MLLNFSLDYAIRKAGETRWSWNWMGHTIFWLMLMMWIYWEITYIL
jgi:hypothetical protein